MTRQMGKKIISLFCVWTALIILGTIRPLYASADTAPATGIDFHISTSLGPYALEKTSDRFMKGLAGALDSLDLSGHAVLQNGQADISGNLNLNGLSAIDFCLTGWEERLSLTTNLFGQKPVVITPPNYVPFLLKMYHYYEIPVQYIAVFTDPYSYLHGIKPALNVWTELLGGTESRSVSPKECIEKAELFSQAMEKNQPFYFWRMGLLQHFNLDELLNEFLFALPDWMAGLVKKDGLKIQVSDLEENWVLGGKPVYSLQRSGETTRWQVDLPEWEGYRLSGNCLMEEKEGGLWLSSEWKLYEGDSPYAYFQLYGQGLPDGKRMQGNGRISVSMGGEGLGFDSTYLAGLNWNQRQEGEKTVIDGQVAFLDPVTEKAMFSVDGHIAFGSTQESFSPKTAEDIQGIDLFCMSEMTIPEFYANAKWPLIRTAIPFLVELPAGFLNGVVDWMEENDILLTLMDGMGR